MSNVQITNPWAPKAYLQHDLARQYSITTYVEVGSTGALVWDILINLDKDYQMLFKHKITLPTAVYVLSRFGVLVYTLMNTIFQTAPLGSHCHIVERTLCVLYHVATSSTALLFLLRVRAIYNKDKYILAFFLFLWLSVVGSSLTAATVGGAEIIEPTKYCLPKTLSPMVSAAPITLTVFDTCVFLAISWRLLVDSWTNPDRKTSLRGILLGQYLPRFSRILLQDGQIYYLISLASNLIVVVIAFTDQLPPTYRFMLVFNCVLTNMLACRVYRSTKLGLFKEDAISTTSMQFTYPTSEFGTSTRPSYRSTVEVNDTVSASEEIKTGVNKRRERAQRVISCVVMALMIALPFSCIFLCKKFKDHSS